MSYAAFVNANNRSANGFFLTSKRPDKNQTSGENEVYEATVAIVAEALKEAKIKSVNVLTSLEALESIVASTVPKVIELSEKHAIESNGSTAYTWAVVFACISAYHESIRKMKLKKNE
jgi:hypothetical protein